MSNVAIIVGAVFFLSVYGGASYYIGRRLFQWLKLIVPPLNGTLFGIVFGIFTLSVIMVFAPLPDALTGITSWIGSYWMGIFVYFLLFYLLMDLVILLARLAKIVPSPVPPKIRIYAGLVVILCVVGFVGYGIYNANQIKQVSYDIQTKASTISAGMKFVLISDLHLGAVNSEKRLESVVNQINRLEPDIVCIAGDIFNDDYDAIQDPEAAIRLFNSISATYGVYASLGNHDGGATFDQMVEFLERSHIQLLNDEYVVIDDRLVLFGRVDPSPIGGFGELSRKDIAALVASLDTSLPVVVMDHTPVNLGQYDEKIDLVLAGHTHKGQIFPANLITNAIFEVDYGHYQRDAASPHVIVTSGAGTWGMPMRVGSNNEVVSIYLH